MTLTRTCYHHSNTGYRLFPVFVFVMISHFTMQAQGMKPSDELRIPKREDFEVTGNGDNPAWNAIDWVTLAQRKNEGKTYATQVKVAYSATGIYFLFVCEDEVITSTLREDFADLYNEDVVEVFFWTDEGDSIYFEYELSPANYELPIIVPNMGGTFLGWLPWHYEGERKTRHATSIVREKGKVKAWKAEFFIPFALLKPLRNVPPVSGTRWRANMYRIDYDSGVSTWTWQPIQKNFHDFMLYGTFVFE